jgi:hypothetical protein
MRKRFYKFSLIAFYLCLLQATPSAAQQDTIKSIEEKFVNSTISHLPEKIYVHTDKELYLAGEIIWFKLYTVDGFFNRPSHLSKVAYVELVDAGNKPVMQAKISLKSNEDNGSFQLPFSVANGNYSLRAYTRWMKDDPAAFFIKQVTIINPLKDPVTDSVENTPNYFIDFFPEGGDLVKNMKSKLAFKVTDKFGKGMAGTGYVLNELNDTAVIFKPLKFGIGTFPFTPVENHTYHAVFRLDDGTIIKNKIPDARESGYTTSLYDAPGSQIKISVHASNPEHQIIYLLTTAHHLVSTSQEINVKNGVGEIYIQKKLLKEHVTQFTLFDNRQQPVCERLYYMQPSQGSPVIIKTNAADYGRRQKVNVNVVTNKKTVDSLDMSMAVIKLDSPAFFNQPNIEQYLSLTSELKGHIEAPEFYFSDDALVKEATDNLMLTHGWRRFSNKNQSTESNNPFASQPFPEYNGHIITCRIIDKNTNLPAPNIQTFLSVPANEYNFYTADSDSAGIVRFDTKNLYGHQQLVFQIQSTNPDFYRIEVLNPFIEKSPAPASSFALPLQNELLENNSIAMQVQNIYNGDTLKTFAAPALKDTLPFFGKAGYTYLLDNYKRFTSMEEVLREYVTPINVVQRNGKLHMRIVNNLMGQVNQDDLLILLDGLPLSESSKIFSYDPLLVKKLEIIPREYNIGNRSYNGVASFTTYKGDYHGFSQELYHIAVD